MRNTNTPIQAKVAALRKMVSATGATIEQSVVTGRPGAAVAPLLAWFEIHQPDGKQGWIVVNEDGNAGEVGMTPSKLEGLLKGNRLDNTITDEARCKAAGLVDVPDAC